MNPGSIAVVSIVGSPPAQRAPGGHAESEPVPEKPCCSHNTRAREPLCMNVGAG
jgi:hypothetical protein